MKMTLFSRMSPTNKPQGSSGDVKPMARTQASSNNLGAQTGITSPTAGGRQAGGGTVAARIGKSPFREAM